MNTISLWIGKSVFFALKLFGRRGAALPGLIVERLSPGFLGAQLSRLPGGVVIIIGTNGKTTTTKMLSHVLRGDQRVLTNPTGSNFTRGIVASIIEHANWSGNLPYDIAVLELDEAYAVKFVTQYKPRGVVVLNVMRDQMDRFAEIDQTAKLLEKVACSATEFAVLNADDLRIADIEKSIKVATYTFGVSAQLRNIFLQDDELHSGPVRAQKHAATVLLDSYKGAEAVYAIAGSRFSAILASHGAHNAQNAGAVLAAVQALGANMPEAVVRLSEVRPAFGRGELFTIGSKKIILQLVKNPGGFRHALLSGEQIDNKTTMIAINDDYPDGRDVSWLWDVDFSSLASNDILTSGVRAADMALRLKYDDIQTTRYEQSLQKGLVALEGRLKAGEVGIIYATYTAMLEIRQHMTRLTEVEKV